MKKLLFFATLTVVFNSYAQDVIVGQNPVELYTCGSNGHLYDSGADTSSYDPGESVIMTICPSPPNPSGNPIALLFNSANFGGPNDFLAIYDGAGTTAAADLIYSFSQTSIPAVGSTYRTSITNLTQCITVQFVSGAASPGGDFDFDIICLPPCKTVVANQPLVSLPYVLNDTVYINSCLNDPITFTGSATYDTNTSLYNQSDATSNFYWDFGNSGLDTGIMVDQSFTPGIYPIGLTVEDVSGCISYNEISLRIRQTLIPKVRFNPSDTTVCLGDSIDIAPYLITTSDEFLLIGDTAVYDTLKVQTSVSIQDTSFLPDDSDNISGNGITTPATFEFPIYGYQPGATLTNIFDLFYVCIDMEHSFVGDLDIILECPNGQTLALVDFTPPGTPGWFMGEPIDPGVGYGIPYTYCWSPTANPGDSIAQGNAGITILGNNAIDTSIQYSPQGDWTSLLGCPLNGDWKIQVFDDYGSDDGYVFGAAIEFDGSFALNPDTFLVSYDSAYWDASSQIYTSLINDSISSYALQNPFMPQTLHFMDNLGCDWEADFDNLKIATLIVSNAFQDTTICTEDSLAIFANIESTNTGCTYTLIMNDAANDGWGNSNITVFLDGINSGQYEVSFSEGGQSIESFDVTEGEYIQLDFDDSDFFLGEISYHLLNSYGDTIFSVFPNPLGGIAFSDTVGCGNTYTYEWFPTAEIDATYQNSVSISPDSETEYYVKVTNSYGCFDYDTSNVYFDTTNAPVIDLTTLANNFCCEGTELKMDINSFVSGPMISQIFIDGNTIPLNTDVIYNSESFINDEVDVHTLRVIANNGCSSEEDFSLYKHCFETEMNIADSIYVGSNAVFEAIVTPLMDSLGFEWSTTDDSPDAITDHLIKDPQYNGIYTGNYDASFTANAYFDQNNGTFLKCVEVAEDRTYYVIDDLEIQYPDAFTPNNGDEINDKFSPIISKNAEILEFRIYNRWGMKVYDLDASEDKEGWDGKVSGADQIADVYTYYVSIRHFDNVYFREGNVNLIR